MGLWKKLTGEPAKNEQAYSTTSEDPRLPGLAGFTSPEPLKKNAMPIRRFNYVRPDGRTEEPPRRR